MKINVKKSEIILMIMDYLKNENLDKTLVSLENESGLQLYEYNREISFLRHLILEGHWKDAEEFLKPLKDHPNFEYNGSIYEIRKQKFLEAVEEEPDSKSNNVEDLVSLLKDLQSRCSQMVFNELMFCLSTPSITNHSEYKNWTPLSGRIKCFSKLRDFLEIIYPINREEIKIQPGALNRVIKNAVCNSINSISKSPTAILNLSILDCSFFPDTPSSNTQVNFEDDFGKKSKKAKDDENEILRKSNSNALKIIRNEKISQSLQVNKISEIEEEEAQMYVQQKLGEELKKPIETLRDQNDPIKDHKKTLNKNNSSNVSNSNNKNNPNSAQLNSSTPIKKGQNSENSYNNSYPVNSTTNNQNLTNLDRFNTSANNFNKNNIISHPSTSKKDENNYAKTYNENISNDVYFPQEDEIEEEIQDDPKLKKSKETNNVKYLKYQNELLVSTNTVKNNLSDLDKEEYYMKSQYEYYDYDITSLLERKVIQDTHPIRTSCFSPKGDFFALGTNSKSVKIFDMKNLNLANMNMKKQSVNYKSYEEDVKLIFEQKNHHLGSIYCLDWSISGRLLATGSNDKLVKLMVIPDLEESNAKEQEILELTISGHRGTIRTVTFDPTSDLVLLSGGTVDHTVKVWDAEKGTNISNLEGHSGDISTIKWSNDSILCGSSGGDKTIRFWDLRDYKSTSLISALKYADINDISIFTRNKSTASTLIASGHADGTITIWDYQKKNVLKEIFEHTQEVRSVSFSPDGRFLVSASFDSTIKIFDVEQDFELVNELEHFDRVVSVKWHPDFPLLLSTSADKTARIWIPES